MTFIETSISYSQPVSELVQQRFSCRTYLKQPIDIQTRQSLEAYASEQQTGPLGGQARFELVAGRDGDLKELKGLGTYGFIKGATGFIVGATADDAKHLEDFGYLLQKIILYATDLGLGSCWLGGTFTKTSFAQKISVREGELVPSVAAVGYIAKKPRRIDALIRRGAKADKRHAWEQLFFKDHFGSPLSHQGAGNYATPLEMVRLAPSASNKQPWRVVKQSSRWHFYLQRTSGYQQRSLLRFNKVADLQRIDMGIAICHFDLTTREMGLTGEWLVEEPEIKKPDALTEYTASWQG
jgi:nitroreductase